MNWDKEIRMAEYLPLNELKITFQWIKILLQVGNVSVSCEQIPLLALEYETPRLQPTLFSITVICSSFEMCGSKYSFFEMDSGPSHSNLLKHP